MVYIIFCTNKSENKILKNHRPIVHRPVDHRPIVHRPVVHQPIVRPPRTALFMSSLYTQYIDYLIPNCCIRMRSFPWGYVHTVHVSVCLSAQLLGVAASVVRELEFGLLRLWVWYPALSNVSCKITSLCNVLIWTVPLSPSCNLGTWFKDRKLLHYGCVTTDLYMCSVVGVNCHWKLNSDEHRKWIGHVCYSE